MLVDLILELDPIEDWDLMIRVAQVTQFHFIPEPLVIIYGTPGSISSFRSNNAAARSRILDKHRALFNGKHAVLARHHYIAGRIWQNLGAQDRALPEFLLSFSETPQVKTLARIIESYVYRIFSKST